MSTIDRYFQEAFVDRDPVAINIVFNEFFPLILRTCSRYVYDEVVSQDIAMEVMEKAFSGAKFNNATHATNFMFMCARNDSINYTRREGARKRKFLRYSLFDNSDPVVDPDMDKKLIAAISSIGELSGKYRLLIQYIYVDRISYKEAAKKMGVSLNSMGAIRKLAMLKLRKILIKKGIKYGE